MSSGSPPLLPGSSAPAPMRFIPRQRSAAGVRSVPQHRRPAQRRAMAEPQRPMQLMMSGLGALIMVAIVGLSAFFILADERRGHGATTTPPPAAAPVREAPLSLAEVFPGAEIQLVAGATPYRIGLTHSDTDCAMAATGVIGGLLTGAGCDQVIRAGMTAPYGDYHVTAGIFTLPDAAAASRVSAQIEPLAEAGDGSFSPLGAAADEVTPAQMNWREQGRFLIYCAISRPDGTPVRDDDPYANQISSDLIGSYLTGTVLDQR